MSEAAGYIVADARDLQQTIAGKILFFLLCASLVWTTLAYGTVHQPIIGLLYISMVVVLILWAVESFLTGWLRFSRSLVQVPLLLTAVYGFIQIIPFGTLPETGGVDGIPRTISVAPFWTMMASVHFLVLFFFLAALLSYIDRFKKIRKVVVLITAFGFLFAFFAILQSFLSPDKIYGVYESRFAEPFGSFVNRHNFAAYMEMSMCVPLGLLFAGAVEKDKRLLYVTAIGLMGIALVRSGSRGGFVALIAGVVFLVILSTRSEGRGRGLLKAGLAVLLVLLIVGGTFLVGGDSSLTRWADTASQGDISTNRFHIWSVTTQVIANNLPFGAGLGAFGVAYTPYDTLNGIARVEQAHNDYLEVLADAGIVGAAIGIFFIFALVKAATKSIRTENLYRRGVALGAAAGCFAILVHSFFDFVLHITAVTLLFLTLVALLVVTGKKYPDDEEVRRPAKRRRAAANVTAIEDRLG